MQKPPNYSKNVFINCPFDDKYFELREILVFTIVYFGFTPRLSLETSDSGASRLEKIVSLIQESKYSIHDLSRLQAETIGEFSRLNMPFELGVDYGLRRFNSNYKDKRSLILATSRYDYMKALSDINGADIKNHNDDVDSMISCLRSWFSETVKLKGLNSSAKISSDFFDFNTELFDAKMLKYVDGHTSTECERFAKKEIEELTLPEFIEEVKVWLKK